MKARLLILLGLVILAIGVLGMVQYGMAVW
jgi:hypothetical protein